ncbi:hypothetical protein TrRE_jg480 [Triparma retinervis]|uniref:RRM domain-containing protein n=1 Tax=Triparma retinervis TaxID=2557542 RepID=A0A9W6ZPN6_9STRA|nr:hypothetical protein TrRE_jg480 [Triparma retinervis]
MSMFEQNTIAPPAGQVMGMGGAPPAAPEGVRLYVGNISFDTDENRLIQTFGTFGELYVGNLSFETTMEAVKQLFEQYGPISDCFLPMDRQTGRPRGFAFVTMAPAEAQTAIQMLNGFELNGRNLQVNQAQPKNRGGGFNQGGFGGGGGFQQGGGFNQGYGGQGYGGQGQGYGQQPVNIGYGGNGGNPGFNAGY